ncbi:histidine phosphatase family protein [Epibacterium ulvae]|uniref:histidine phosphatase family protein n=1 Tax=Epibacterium ulvae TaxID=1156985 RepID=UPI002492856D|nr:histidine phosphatase family protein [Epibacterium ulvae]
MSKTEFFLIRHGPTHAKSMVGWSDLPADLSDTAMLKRISAALPKDALVISSDLTRASATADALQGTRTRLRHDNRLREIHFGAWELRTWAEIDAESPDHIRAFWETPGNIAPPDGESWNDLRKRVDAAFDRLLDQYAGQKIVVVGHFGQILTQVQRACAWSTPRAFEQKIDNLSVSTLSHYDGVWSSSGINQIL